MIKLAPPNRKLGYIWRYCNYAIRLAEATGEQVSISTVANSSKKHGNLLDISGLIQEVLENLQYDVKINLHSDLEGVQKPDMTSYVPYAPTKIRWNIKNVKEYKVCYQFDGEGISNWHQNTLDGLRYFYKNVQNAESLSKKYSIKEITEKLSTAFLYIGADSGISHIANSVGVPTFILGNKNSLHITEKWHNGNRYILQNCLRHFSTTVFTHFQNDIAEYVKLGEYFNGSNRQYTLRV